MNHGDIERAAYVAAHRILATNTSAPELACPGARRSYAIDAIAQAIKDTFDVFIDELEVKRVAEPKPPARAVHGRASIVLRLPQRAS